MRRTFLILLAVVLIAAPLSAKKKKHTVGFVMKPGLEVTLEGVQLVNAAQACPNWFLAAALETALRAQGAEVDQHLLVQKGNGGELCMDRPEDLRDVVNAVADEMPIGNDVKLRLSASLEPGAPRSTDTVLAGVVTRKPVIVLWQGHAYLVAGAKYDERDAPDGSRVYQINQLTLLDPADGGTVVFDREQHAMSDLDGMVTVSVTRVEAQTWSPTAPSWKPQ